MPDAIKGVDPNSVVMSPNNRGESGIKQDPECQLVKSLLSQGKQYRSEFDEDWQTRKEFYRGQQWKKTSKTTHSKPVMNIIRQMIQATIPILTDQRPGIGIMAKEPSDFQFSQVMGDLVENWWDNSSMDHTIVEVVFDSMLLDCGIFKVTWDPSIDDGLGDVLVERIDPDDIYVPKGSRDFTKGCGWVIQLSKKTVGEVKRLFPDMKNYIKPDTDDKGSDVEKKNSEDIKLVSPVDQYSSKGMSGPDGMSDRKMCTIAECWIDDETTVEEMVEREDGSQEAIIKKRFPRGKLITVLPNQGVTLQSVEHPYMHGRKPYVRLVDMILPGEFYGEGEAKALMPQQKMLNKTLAHIFDTFQMISNPAWFVSEDSGVNIETISNRISTIIKTAAGKSGPDSIRRDFPPALQSGMLDIYHTIITQAEQTSGISEISQGRKPIGVTAAAAIENLQEASQTRIRLKERNMNVSLQQLGYQIVSLMLQFYRDARVVRLTNKPGVWPDYIDFYIEENQPGQYVMNSRRSVYNEAANDYQTEPNYNTTSVSKGIFDIKVLSGTAMPWAKTTRANIAFRLYDAGAIDEEELLEALEWPNGKQIIERMKQRAAATPQPQQ